MNVRASLGSALVCSAIALSVALWSPAVSAQNVKEKFTGFAINMNSGPKTAVLDFTITRWSTDEERAQLLAIIKENKNPTDKLLRALQKLPKVGFIRTTQSLGWDLHYRARKRRSTKGAVRSCSRPTARSTSGRRATSRARSTTRSPSSRCIWTRTTRDRARFSSAPRSTSTRRTTWSSRITPSSR